MDESGRDRFQKGQSLSDKFAKNCAKLDAEFLPRLSLTKPLWKRRSFESSESDIDIEARSSTHIGHFSRNLK